MLLRKTNQLHICIADALGPTNLQDMDNFVVTELFQTFWMRNVEITTLT